eukprot:1295672-Rhodomonas_salina.2
MNAQHDPWSVGDAKVPMMGSSSVAAAASGECRERQDECYHHGLLPLVDRLEKPTILSVGGERPNDLNGILLATARPVSRTGPRIVQSFYDRRNATSP